MAKYNIYAGLRELGGKKFLYSEHFNSQVEAMDMARCQAYQLYENHHKDDFLGKIIQDYCNTNNISPLSLADEDWENIDRMEYEIVEDAVSYDAIRSSEDPNYSSIEEW